MEYNSEVLSLVKNSVFLCELFIFLFIAKWVYEKVSTFSFMHELTEKDNLAFSITLAGYLIGVAIVLLGIVSAENHAMEQATIDAVVSGKLQSMPNMFMIQVSDMAVYSSLGIVLLLFSRIINDKFILPRFSIQKEILEDQNSGTGVVILASFVSTAFIINASLSGEGFSLISCLFFYAIGQVVLILFAKLYQFITPFDVHDEIEKDNVAVGCSFAGTLLGIGILVAKGITGEFDSIGDLATNLLCYTLLGFLLFPLARVIFDKFFIPGVDLSTELVRDRNIGLGILEGSTAIILASAIYYAM